MIPPEDKDGETELRAVFVDGEELKIFLMIRGILESRSERIPRSLLRG